ncbi:MAG: S-layer homology domain-containing protein [Clostridiales bacterium]|nr:S-layer homology domain-containing protein [Clostridiales bacterium]
MKRAISLLLTASLLLVLCAPVSAASLTKFQKVNTYEAGHFFDVDSSKWYAENVQITYEYGLMTGKSGAKFDPDGNLTVAEAIVIASRLHNTYYGNNADFSGASPWYQSYVDYAKRNKIIERDYSYGAPISRLDFALFISNALPDSALPKINNIKQNDIPDLYAGSPCSDAVTVLVNSGVLGSGAASRLQLLSSAMGAGTISASKEQDAVYRLYRAGILAGSDRYGTFNPASNIMRSEVAAILSRIVEPSLRKQVTLVKKTVELVPVDQLANLPSVKRRASSAQFAEAYEVAKTVVEPLRGLSREVQLCAIALALRVITENNITYSMESANYGDPYGFFVDHSASCAGCTRATGLCLNMLGIPYEHVNENAYSHQWTRVNLNGTYWICDAYGLYCGPEQAPYQHPRFP